MLCPNNAKLDGCGMGMGFAPTWLRQVSPLLHMTTLTTRRWLQLTTAMDQQHKTAT